MNYRYLATHSLDRSCLGPLYVIMEFAPHGNLRDYLRQLTAHDTSDFDHPRNQEPADVDDVISGDSETLTYDDLLSFAVQVARGLQFLTERLVSSHTGIFYTLVSDGWIYNEQTIL